jgi:hypothetical protein
MARAKRWTIPIAFNLEDAKKIEECAVNFDGNRSMVVKMAVKEYFDRKLVTA